MSRKINREKGQLSVEELLTSIHEKLDKGEVELSDKCFGYYEWAIDDDEYSEITECSKVDGGILIQ